MAWASCCLPLARRPLMPAAGPEREPASPALPRQMRLGFHREKGQAHGCQSHASRLSSWGLRVVRAVDFL